MRPTEESGCPRCLIAGLVFAGLVFAGLTFTWLVFTGLVITELVVTELVVGGLVSGTGRMKGRGDVAQAQTNLSGARSLAMQAECECAPHRRYQAAMQAARQGALVLLKSSEQRRRHVGALSDALGQADLASVWVQVARSVPRFAEWASYYALLEPRPALSERQIDDLVRDAGLFLDAVEQYLARPVGRVSSLGRAGSVGRVSSVGRAGSAGRAGSLARAGSENCAAEAKNA